MKRRKRRSNRYVDGGRVRHVLFVARKILARAALVLAAVLLLTAGASIWGFARVRIDRPAGTLTVNDVTGLNPIPVQDAFAPGGTLEIVEAVRSHPGPISIGGGRFSQGGQTAAEGSLHIDMRGMDRILSIDTAGRTITVQAGATWRKIQSAIDTLGLAVKIMQTYANFTVGGSMSVNAHGRYIGLGPLILSVRSFQIVLADGSVVEATPTQNADIFYGAIGGYGGLGVITQATLELTENVRVRREHRTMPIADYGEWFRANVRGADSVVLHNADLYPNEYEQVGALSYVRTDEPVTIEERLIPEDRTYRMHRLVYGVISEWPFGEEIREHIVDPLAFRGHQVTWRNWEASYDVAELEPRSRENSTYVLQEYFVPVARFDEFVPKMRRVFQQHDVNVINVSIRHALPDPGSLMAWAREEVFAFVVYYKQDTGAAAVAEVRDWTRALIDEVLAVGGTYYLPYQPHATDEQFLRAYPRAPEFFELKHRLDPTNKFRNALWDEYFPDPALSRLTVGDELRARLDTTAGYARPRSQAYLAHPEWSIVYSFHEFADWSRDKLPTSFPYAVSAGQYWAHYLEARRLTKRMPGNLPYHVMLAVIGTSYSVELTLKGLYENTIGRASGWTSGGALSDEDRFAAGVADEYAHFVHVRPWYEFPFGVRLAELWSEVPFVGEHMIRKLERRLLLTAEYGIKAGYAKVIEMATRGAYAYPDETRRMVVTGWTDALPAGTPGRAPSPADSARPLPAGTLGRAPIDGARTMIVTPQFDGFRDAVLELARQTEDVTILEVAGNREVLLTGIAPANWRFAAPAGEMLYGMRLATAPDRRRVLLRVPAQRLLEVVRSLQREGALNVDHIYDY